MVPHPKIIIHIDNDMDIRIHIDINMNMDIHIIININMNIDIHIIIDMKIEDYIWYYLLINIPIGYSLLGLPYRVFPIGHSL